VAGEDPVFFVLPENDLFFHNHKVDRNGTRVNEVWTRAPEA
jgi:hypothetical protein